ncbi:hypothetical protein ACFE04_002604 [Oxalis oulophora]
MRHTHYTSLIHSVSIVKKAHTLTNNPTIASLRSGHVHHQSEDIGLNSNPLYIKARKLFDEIPDLDVRSATTIIGKFAREHQHGQALYLFLRMLVLNIRPSEYSFGTVIHSSTALKDYFLGKQLHGFAAKVGLNSNVFVGSAMLDLYSKLSTIEEAQRAFEDIDNPNIVSYTSLINGLLKQERFEDALRIFRQMPERNVVSWNAMISGYSQTGHSEDAVNLFIDMLRQGYVPNQSTFPSVISAGSNIAALGMGKSFHASAIKFLGRFSVFVGNSLISCYAKCGNMEDSLLVFNKLPERNTISWNAVICGYAQNGRGHEAIEFYERMISENIKPSDVTILGLLWACNHAGLVNEGYSYFNKVRREEPMLLKSEHYACMVDLLSRSGRFFEAENFLHELPFNPGIGFWKALLGGCQIYSNLELGRFAARKIVELDPEDVSSYVMMSNAHSAAGRWENVSTLRKEMKEKGLKRVPGCSWIEVRNKVHVFVAIDRNHSDKNEIYNMLMTFLLHVKDDEVMNCIQYEIR